MADETVGSTGDDEPDIATMSDEEVDAELKRRGIDVGPAWAKVKAALHWEKVRRALELHANPRPAISSTLTHRAVEPGATNEH